MDFIPHMTSKMNCFFARGEFSFDDQEEPPPTPERARGQYKLSDGTMTKPRRIPTVPEEELPNLTRTTPGLTKKGTPREKNPKYKVPFIITDKEKEEQQPKKPKKGTKGTERQRISPQTTPRKSKEEQPSKVTQGDQLSEDGTGITAEREGEPARLIEQCSIIQLRK